MTTVADPPVTVRLLAGLPLNGSRTQLSAHLDAHGPLPPVSSASGWADQLIAVVAESGLTGRGGAAFPTATKLATVRAQGRHPVVAVNMMEGEPASAKDRMLALQAPHLVLDGAVVVASALGARIVHVCIPEHDPAAAASMQAAITERSALRHPKVELIVSSPPRGYVSGEESALTHWLDGGEALPTFRPDKPTVLRVKGRPTLVDNAETMANIALIARHGAQWFRAAGTASAPGTTLVTVSGAVPAPRVVEVSFGTPVREILAAAGVEARPGGILLGGYGGTWLSAHDAGTPYEPAALAGVGATTGVGVMVALPPGGCGLAETARVATWMAGESAGQCGPCVFGLPAIAADLRDVAFGYGQRATARRLQARLPAVVGRGACRHPDGVVRMVDSALRVFADDLHRHLTAGPCPGARWPSAMTFPATAEGVA